MQIVEFLTARLDERERLHRHAPDFIEDPTSARSPGWGNCGEFCPVCGQYQFSGTESVCEEAWYEHAEEVHDRKWVLADIAAKRAILEFHKQWPVLIEGPSEMVETDTSGLDSIAFKMSRKIAWMTDQEYRNRFGDEPPTTPIMRALASIWSDHPDYDEAWRL